MSKASSDEVFNFLLKVKDRASGLTLREGSKRLPEKQRFYLELDSILCLTEILLMGAPIDSLVPHYGMPFDCVTDWNRKNRFLTF